MRRIINFLLCLLGPLGMLQALAQTPTPLPVQGNLSSIIGSGQQYAGVSIQLQNCSSPVSITGYSVIVQQGYQVMANGSGLVNTNVWPNDLITCNGTTGNSQYQLSYTANGAVQGTPQCYQVVSTQGTWNLNAQQPIACAQTPPNPADYQYRNLNLTGFLSGVNGAMSGTWQAASFTATGMAANSGKCAQWGTGGSLGAASFACGSGGGVTQILAGSNVTVSPSGGTGAVTINATGGGSGGVNAGTAGQIAYYAANGSTVSGQNAVPVSAGGTGGTTQASALGGIGAAAFGGAPGIPFQITTSTARLATGSDLIPLLGYTPLQPANNLSDVASSYTSLQNLFSLSGLASAQLIGTTSGGAPVPITVTQGLTYVAATGAGSVVSMIVTAPGDYNVEVCPSLAFSGGGGSGAAATAICSRGIYPGLVPTPFSYVSGYVITNPGSSYTSAPTVTPTPSGATFTAYLGGTGTLSPSYENGTFYSVAGTPLPSCAAGLILQRLGVSDASSATPGTTYTGGGPYTIPVECIFNATGSVYTWIID